jgi:hypothetical protein
LIDPRIAALKAGIREAQANFVILRKSRDVMPRIRTIDGICR